MFPELSATAVIADILEELGYKANWFSGTSQQHLNMSHDLVSQGLKYGEYEYIPPYIRFRVPYGKTGHKKYGSLKIIGQRIHIYDRKIGCIFIDLADPGSLDRLRSFISDIEEMDVYPNSQEANPGTCY